MPSLWCAATCGWRLRFFYCPPSTLIYGKSRPLCTTDLSIPLLTPLELRKVQLLEHLHDGAAAWAPGAAAVKAWVTEQARRIDEGGVAEVVAECRSLAGANMEHPLNRLAGYLENRQEQMDYAAARREGLPIGSGAVEGGHRYVIQDRLKLPGAWWKEDTVNPMLALRTLRANGQWEPFWN